MTQPQDFQQELGEASYTHQVGPVHQSGNNKTHFNNNHGRVSTTTSPEQVVGLHVSNDGVPTTIQANPSTQLPSLPMKDKSGLTETDMSQDPSSFRRGGKDSNSVTANDSSVESNTPVINENSGKDGPNSSKVDDKDKVDSEDEDEEEESEMWVYLVALILFLVTTAGLSCIVLFVFGAAGNREEEDTSVLQSQLEYLSGNETTVFEDPESPQSLAITWLAGDANTAEILDDPVRREARYALAVLYYSTGGTNSWINSLNFLSEDHECQWFNQSSPVLVGVQCEDNVTVVRISIESNGLVGSLPRELSGLSDLQFLDLSDNALSGTLPEWMFANLQELDLESNHIEGSLPDSLFNMASLKTLDLSLNLLSSTIPNSMYQLSNLEYLRMGGNNFYGPLGGVETLIQLKELNMTTNAISGELDFVMNFPKLEILDVSFNNFLGTIPFLLGRLTSLRKLLFSQNEVYGKLPTKLGLLSDLEYLDGSNNMLSGTFPWSSFTVRNSLEQLVLSNNLLSGSISSDISNYRNLEILDFASNKLSGSLPFAMGGMSGLKEISFTSNQITGEIPTTMAFMSSLVSLNLSGNWMNSTIPTMLGSLTSLKTLLLDNNGFFGTLPDELSQLVQIERIGLQNNHLTGSVDFLCTIDPPPIISADCGGNPPEVECSCCNNCVV